MPLDISRYKALMAARSIASPNANAGNVNSVYLDSNDDETFDTALRQINSILPAQKDIIARIIDCFTHGTTMTKTMDFHYIDLIYDGEAILRVHGQSSEQIDIFCIDINTFVAEYKPIRAHKKYIRRRVLRCIGLVAIVAIVAIWCFY
jgi:hypothetical protein